MYIQVITHFLHYFRLHCSGIWASALASAGPHPNPSASDSQKPGSKKPDKWSNGKAKDKWQISARQSDKTWESWDFVGWLYIYIHIYIYIYAICRRNVSQVLYVLIYPTIYYPRKLDPTDRKLIKPISNLHKQTVFWLAVWRGNHPWASHLGCPRMRFSHVCTVGQPKKLLDPHVPYYSLVN